MQWGGVLLCLATLSMTSCDVVGVPDNASGKYTIKLNTEDLILTLGESAVRASANATAGTTYTSSDEKIATVDRTGRVTAVAEGECVITVSTPYLATKTIEGDEILGTATAEFRVIVKKKAGSISYATTAVSKLPTDAAFINELTKVGDGTVTYESSNEAVATVNATTGEVTIVGPGETTITATASNSDTYAYETPATYTLTVKNRVDLSTITANLTVQNGIVLTGTLANNVEIRIAAGATITLKDADINGSGAWTSSNWAGLTPEGNATIILEGTNTVKGFSASYPGIYAAKGSTLTIQGTGSLTVKGGNMGCGIGSYSCGENGGNIVIAGGDITAEGGDYAAAIGSGNSTSCGTISITGGTVTATGGTGSNGDGTGIGAGNGGSTVGESKSSCENISITGGTVTATGKNNGAGIGGGWNSVCGTITIGSGVTTVTATKGNNANSIGAGNQGTCGTVSIDGGANVTQN